MRTDVLVETLERNGKQSRAHLVHVLNLDQTSKNPDRTLRNLKERINLSDGKYEDILIVGFSTGKGYKIAETKEELQHFICEMKSRRISMDIQINKAEKILKKLEDNEV